MSPENEIKEPVLHVFSQKSVYEAANGQIFTFEEGKPSKDAQDRLKKIRRLLEEGYFPKLIEECQNPQATTLNLTEEQIVVLEVFGNSITSDAGRAVVGLMLMQLVIKSLEPIQSIRLHKSNSNGKDFSWKEGLPMRGLDEDYITPVLRDFDLIRMNKYGIMMTRTLAENYPYTFLYKASIKGVKRHWATIVEWVETDVIDANQALRYLIGLLLNKTADFKKNAQDLLAKVNTFLLDSFSFQVVLLKIQEFINKSDYSARVFEIVIHSLFQVFEELGVIEGHLKPLSQMRSANKKHGNIGDIEITITKSSLDIIETWDAKYGKPYLREELEELNDKLHAHPQTEIAGFITDIEPNLKDEIRNRVAELSEFHNVKIDILCFTDWVNMQISKYKLQPDTVAKYWLIAITESLCQYRREIAPIDEPTGAWITTLKQVLDS